MRTRRPLGSDIVASLGRALREEQYAVADHLLQALEEFEEGAANSQGRARRSPNLDAAYLEIARTLRTEPQIGVSKGAIVESFSEHRRDKQ